MTNSPPGAYDPPPPPKRRPRWPWTVGGPVVLVIVAAIGGGCAKEADETITAETTTTTEAAEQPATTRRPATTTTTVAPPPPTTVALPPPPPPPVEPVVIYEVNGEGSALVTYAVAGFSQEQHEVELPWSHEIRGAGVLPQFPILLAQLQGTGDITCKIWRGGATPVAEATSSGQYVVVSCSDD